jgi:hypothetical protein
MYCGLCIRESRLTVKGITLPINQFAALVKALPAVEQVLKERGERLPRPDYDKLGKDGAAEELDDTDAEKKSEAKRERKRNFEETSEED